MGKLIEVGAKAAQIAANIAVYGVCMQMGLPLGTCFRFYTFKLHISYAALYPKFLDI